ncbi:DNA-directed RNA polymerase subunit N [Candidatus Woesearchaeota archaeon]|nr:DNA-directed RNA polymerase subunit N [Candidatus Woesearchaeota archaeon]
MMIPVRCFSCGKPVAHLWDSYQERVKAGEERKKVMDDLGLERYCCRATFLGHLEIIDQIARFRKT